MIDRAALADAVLAATGRPLEPDDADEIDQRCVNAELLAADLTGASHVCDDPVDFAKTGPGDPYRKWLALTLEHSFGCVALLLSLRDNRHNPDVGDDVRAQIAAAADYLVDQTDALLVDGYDPHNQPNRKDSRS